VRKRAYASLWVLLYGCTVKRRVTISFFDSRFCTNSTGKKLEARLPPELALQSKVRRLTKERYAVRELVLARELGTGGLTAVSYPTPPVRQLSGPESQRLQTALGSVWCMMALCRSEVSR
jgi:hypothetical protein